MFSFSVVGGILISGALLLLFLRVRRRSRILLPSQIGAGSARRAREGLLISAGRASHAVAAAPPLGARAPSAGRVGIVRSAERTLRASTRAASAVAIASRRHREFRWYVGATMITVFVTYVMTLVAR